MKYTLRVCVLYPLVIGIGTTGLTRIPNLAHAGWVSLIAFFVLFFLWGEFSFRPWFVKRRALSR